MMDIINDQTVAGMIVAFVIGQTGIWLDSRRSSKKTDGKIDVVGRNADSAVTAAELAAKRSEPTSNGFAEDMREGMSDLKEGQKNISKKLDRHIEDHASSDVLRKNKGEGNA